jgi:hypothetical protein
MAAIGEGCKIFNGLHNPRPKRVQMDVTNKFLAIGIFLTNDGFVAVLEKLAVPLVHPVKMDRIAGEQTGHGNGKRHVARAYKEVDMLCEASDYVK